MEATCPGRRVIDRGKRVRAVICSSVAPPTPPQPVFSLLCLFSFSLSLSLFPSHSLLGARGMLHIRSVLEVCVCVWVYVRWCLFLSVFACLLCVFALKWERVEAGLSGGRGLSMWVWNSGRPVSFFFHPPPPTCRAHAYFIEVVVCVASRRAAGSNQ